MPLAKLPLCYYLSFCTEIGHGFGLPHTDENHNNQDTGNCLDYTNNPENNLHPGQVNFNRLASAYLKNYGQNDDDEEVVAEYYYTNNDDNPQYDDTYGGGQGRKRGRNLRQYSRPRQVIRRVIKRYYLRPWDDSYSTEPYWK